MDNTLPQLLRRVATGNPDIIAQYWKDSSGEFASIPYRELYALALDFASGLLAIGHARGDRVGLIADNRKEWLQASMGIMAIGGADVPRGTDATVGELEFILSFAECHTAAIENDSVAKKILERRTSLPFLKNLVFLDLPGPARVDEIRSAGFSVMGFGELVTRGREWRAANPGKIESVVDAGTSDEIATVIFTSGTTGEPKGVMLSHGNFLCQLPDLSTRIVLNPGDRALCVLPVWHSFERLCEYVIINGVTAIVYSKPIGSVLLADLSKMNPHLMPSVPRIWESVYDGIFRLMRKKGGVSWALFSFFVSVAILDSRLERRVFWTGPIFSRAHAAFGALACFLPWILLLPLKALGGLLVFRKIRAKLGKNFREGVSGGGALPPNIDEFFWAVGVRIVEGYGLTETAPVVAVRPYSRPIFGTIGKPLSCCEAKIVDESGAECPVGVKGTVLVRGGNVMKGYYRKDELTAKVLSPDGWLDTGDLGLKTLAGELILRGRKKDTIVLRGGENIEPAPIEMKINESRFVSQSVVLGQDERYLGALIVVNSEELVAWARDNSVEGETIRELIADAAVQKLYEGEVADLVSQKNGFKLFERVNRVVLLERPFEKGVELSAKQEIMRHKIPELYRKELKILFD